MQDLLHDEIDEQEDLRNRAMGIVEDARLVIFDAVREVDDTGKALEAIALLVEHKLKDLTTEAVRAGARHAQRQAELASRRK